MKKGALITFILLVFIIIWFWQPLRSIVVMSVYSAIHEKDSIMAKNGFDIEIPGGFSTIERDWYPFVMTFNADGYMARDGLVNGMTILYNFPAFNPLTRTNIFYEPDSPYNSSFYGAYVIESVGITPYCYMDDGSPDYAEVMHAFKYDYVNLVLESLGDKEFEFVVRQFTGRETDFISYSGWTMVNAVLDTNSVTHVYEESKRSYLQYGRPTGRTNNSFAEQQMHGRLYMRFFPEYDSTVIFYILAKERSLINECDDKILSKSILSAN